MLTESSVIETRPFFRELIDQNLRVRHLVDSSFAFVNVRLARHYGLPVFETVGLRRVELPDDSASGGLLTQASATGQQQFANDSCRWRHDFRRLSQHVSVLQQMGFETDQFASATGTMLGLDARYPNVARMWGPQICRVLRSNANAIAPVIARPVQIRAG